MIINLVWFLFGALVGTVALIVISCCYASGKCSREEERRDDRDPTESGD